MKLSLLIVIFLSLLMCPPVWSQTDFGIEGGFGDPHFFVDIASFREDRGEKYEVEVYYKIYHPKLTFIRQEQGFLASYELGLTILRKKGGQVTARSIEGNHLVESYDNSISPNEYLVGLEKFSLYSGEYILVAKLIDRNSKRRVELKKNFSMPSRLKKGAFISHIQLNIKVNRDSSSSHFVKLKRELIPSVSNIFGEHDSTMFAYFEVYPEPKKLGEYILVYEISGRKEVILEKKESVKIAEKKLAQIKEFAMEKLKAGDYILNIKLHSKNGKFLTQSDKEFRIEWSPLSLLKKDYDKAIGQLKYVAEEDEMEKLKNVEVSEREKAWEEFWEPKDPTPNTEKNEMKDEYYKRLSYANANFGVYNKEGWEVDMGMVYIIYGHPDEVEKHYFDRETDRFKGEYMIWYYYRLRPERRFFFKDSGYGEYYLEYPYDGIQRY